MAPLTWWKSRLARWFESETSGSPPWTRFELMCHKLTCARTDESPLPEPPADLKQTLVLLGRPVRTRLELHPEQASRTKLAKLCGHTTWTRFGLGRRQGQSMAEEWEFHAQSAGYLFFTCSLQTMAPAVASHGLCVAFPHDHSTHAENRTVETSISRCDPARSSALIGVPPRGAQDAWDKVDNNAVMYDPDFLRPYEAAAQTVEVLPGSKNSIDLKLTLNTE